MEVIGFFYYLFVLGLFVWIYLWLRSESGESEQDSLRLRLRYTIKWFACCGSLTFCLLSLTYLNIYDYIFEWRDLIAPVMMSAFYLVVGGTIAKMTLIGNGTYAKGYGIFTACLPVWGLFGLYYFLLALRFLIDLFL